MKSVDAKAASISDLSADFEQKKFTPLLKKPMISSGTVLAKGAAMLWTTRAPEPTVMRVDERELSIYYQNQKTVEIYPISGQMAQMAASPVPRLAALLEHFSFAPAGEDEFGEKVDAGRLALRMVPTDPAIREHVDKVTVLIDTERGFILAFTLIDADAERTEIRFSNVRINTKLDEAQLKLRLPAGVKTVHPLEELGSPPSNTGATSK